MTLVALHGRCPPPAASTSTSTAFRWRWRFDYPDAGVAVEGDPDRGPRWSSRSASRPHHADADDVDPRLLRARSSCSSATRSRAIPNEFDFTSTKPGTYGGQCAEFCGVYHSRMLFTVRAVTRPEYEAWLAAHAAAASRRRRAARRRPPAPSASSGIGRHDDDAARRSLEPPSPLTHRLPSGGLTGWLTTTDHKRIGILYMTSAFVFFLVGGLMAAVMRTELAAPGLQLVDRGGLQPAVHDARHDHDAAVRTPMAIGLRELPRPAPDRRRGHGVPAAERAVVLAVPVRRRSSSCRLPRPRRAGGRRLDRLRARSATPTTARRRRRPVDRRAGRSSARRAILARSTSSSRSTLPRARHAHVPDADLHLEHPRDGAPDPVRVPGPHRGPGDALHRPAARRHLLRARRSAATRSCGSTCSGSSATPRSTS